MKTIEKTICNNCGRIFFGSAQIEVCGNCGNERSFTVIWTDSEIGWELGGEE